MAYDKASLEKSAKNSTKVAVTLKAIDQIQGKRLKPSDTLAELVQSVVYLFSINADLITTLKDSFGLARLNPANLEVVSLAKLKAQYSQAPLFSVVRRAELYGIYVHQWCRREVVRQMSEDAHWLEKASTDINLWEKECASRVDKVIAFSKKVAFEMFKNNAVVVDLASDAKNISSLRSMFEVNPIEISCSPMRASGNVYSFVHKTAVLEYFVALTVIQNLATTPDISNMASVAISQDWLNKQDNNILQFCSDFVDRRVQHYISNTDTFIKRIAFRHISVFMGSHPAFPRR